MQLYIISLEMKFAFVRLGYEKINMQSVGLTNFFKMTSIIAPSFGNAGWPGLLKAILYSVSSGYNTLIGYFGCPPTWTDTVFILMLCGKCNRIVHVIGVDF